MDHKYSHHNRRKYSLKVHIVLVTKYRKPLLKGCIADDVKQKIYDIYKRKFFRVPPQKHLFLIPPYLAIFHPEYEN